MEIKDLQQYGFNLEEAMELCINDEDIYKEVLETALEEGLEKIPFMKGLMDAGDMERYIIEAHGLKNAARQIGADELSDMAKASELEGKAGNASFVKENHEKLMEKYQETMDVLKQLF